MAETSLSYPSAISHQPSAISHQPSAICHQAGLCQRPAREEAMTRENVSRAVLMAVIVSAWVGGKRLSTPELEAQATQAEARSLPTFEVDRAWPTVPPQWKLGDASSIAIDRQENVWA